MKGFLFVALGVLAGTSAFAAGTQVAQNQTQQQRIQSEGRHEGARIDSEVQYLQEWIQVLQSKKMCLTSANTYDDVNVCRAKEQQGMSQAQLQKAERQKTIDQQKY